MLDGLGSRVAAGSYQQCLLVLPFVVHAQFTFTTNNNAITLTTYTGPGGDVVIPSTTNGFPVTSIGFGAFQNCTSLTNVTIPNSVTNLGNYVFYYCTNLTSVTIPNGVTNIGFGEFQNCTSLTNVTIPNSVTSIAQQAFYSCTSLTNPTIPASVSSIGAFAFWDCASLPDVTISSGVSSIGGSAFQNCFSLTNVTIGNSVTNIGESAFEYCSSLTSINVGSNNHSYCDVAGVLFNKCRTVIVAYPAGLSGMYVIPNSVTDIGNGAFGGCAGLPNIIIPNSVIGIGSQAFAYCTGLTNVTIGNRVATIWSQAFHACSKLTKAYFWGNAPSGNDTIFSGETGIVYYLPGTTGWDPTFGGWPTTLWYPPNPLILGSGYGLGITTNGFGFTISWAPYASIVVEACTNLSNPVWSPVSTNSLLNGTNCFCDPSWTNYPNRFYRVRWP